MMVSHDDIINAIKTVYDPEIPVNIWDLGLIYNIEINESELEVVEAKAQKNGKFEIKKSKDGRFVLEGTEPLNEAFHE